MTTKELKLIDEAIINHGDDFWNDDNNDGEQDNPNRGWIVEELLSILAKGGLDLKIIPKA